MRSTILLSSLLGAALVSAVPKAKSSSSCVCTETATITSTIVDRTVNVKSTTTIPTTLAGNTKTIKSITTVENDYTTTVTRPTTVLVTAGAGGTAVVLARDVFLGKQKNQCLCGSTTTVIKTKVAHTKTTATSIVTKLDKMPGPQVTIPLFQTKTMSSLVETDTVYSSVYSTIYPTTSSAPVVVATRPIAGSSSSTAPEFTSSTVPSFTSSSMPSFTSSTVPRPSPSGTGPFGDCSIVPSSFFVQVQGSRDGFLSIDEYGYASVQTANNASTLSLDSNSSALVLPNDEDNYYDPGATIYSCSNANGGYNEEMLFFTDSEDGQECASGLMTFSLASDCTFTVADDNGPLAPTVGDAGDFWLVNPDDEDYYDSVPGRSPATLLAVPAS